MARACAYRRPVTLAVWKQSSTSLLRTRSSVLCRSSSSDELRKVGAASRRSRRRRCTAAGRQALIEYALAAVDALEAGGLDAARREEWRPLSPTATHSLYSLASPRLMAWDPSGGQKLVTSASSLKSYSNPNNAYWRRHTPSLH